LLPMQASSLSPLAGRGEESARRGEVIAWIG
jgi:hypothetical protein